MSAKRLSHGTTCQGIIPGGGGVRDSETTDDGKNIVMVESGVNKIALVEICGAAGSR